ncbi:MAG: cytidine deaminase [Ruminococcaceae bacterium]|nr:cytidine deaminase [Oscillospiraceae bacterium]
MNREELVKRALDAREKAYSPYSDFCVGAALLCDDGEIFEGANIENCSFGATNCAERTAIFSAVYAGKRSFRAIAIVGGSRGEEVNEYCPPCGICRQVLAEFCSADAEIILFDGKNIKVRKMIEMLPEVFDGANL